MHLTIAPFTEKEAKEVCAWNYPPPYQVYNNPNWEIAQKLGWGLTQAPVRSREFYSLCSAGLLAGFFRLMEEETCVLLGIGLRPDLCGQGLGRAAMALACQTAFQRYPNKPLRLEVRAFNLRAIQCYQRAGFVPIGSSVKKAGQEAPAEFILMEYRHQ